MAEKLFLLKADDLAILREVIDDYRKRRYSTPGRARIEPDEHQAPEVYIARTPASGIDALRGHSGTDITDDEPGSALCNIYRIVPTAAPAGTDTNAEIRAVESFEKRIYNLSSTAVAADSWIPVMRDKYGYWLAVSNAASVSGGDTRITNTVTIGPGPGPPSGTGDIYINGDVFIDLSTGFFYYFYNDVFYQVTLPSDLTMYTIRQYSAFLNLNESASGTLTNTEEKIVEWETPPGAVAPFGGYDPDGLFNGSDSFVIPVSAYYRLDFQAGFEANATGSRRVQIDLFSDGTVGASLVATLCGTQVQAVTTGDPTRICTGGVFWLAAGSAVRAHAFQDSGGDLDLLGTFLGPITNITTFSIAAFGQQPVF